MNETILIAVLTALTSSGACSIILYLIQRHDLKKDKSSAAEKLQSDMLMGLGHDRIVYLGASYIERGYITPGRIREPARVPLQALRCTGRQRDGQADHGGGRKTTTAQGIKEDRNMQKIDWIRKLTSRKFWLSVASFVAMLIVALGGGENTAQQITALIMAGATVIGYVLGEGLADAGNKPEDGTDQ